jgi:cell division protein FtsL
METILHNSKVELLQIVLLLIAFLAFITMDLFNRIKNLIDTKNNTIVAQSAEIENLKVEIANLNTQLAQYAGVNDVANLLTEQGF